MSMLAVLWLGLAAAQSQLARSPGQLVLHSAYTRLDLDRCQRLSRDPAGARWRCPGYGGTPLFVQSGDERFDLDAGREDRDERWTEGFNDLPKTIEWRLVGKRPIAIIYRLVTSGGPAPTSLLAVESVGRTRAGCRIAEIPGSVAGANDKARQAAKAALSANPPCLQAREP